MIAYEPADERDEAKFLPWRLPTGWRRLAAPGPSWVLESPGNPHHNLAVLASVGTEGDGRLWLHVSASHPTRIPLRGRGRAAHVLHLWAPLEGEPALPDFLAARGGTL